MTTPPLAVRGRSRQACHRWLLLWRLSIHYTWRQRASLPLGRLSLERGRPFGSDKLGAVHLLWILCCRWRLAALRLAASELFVAPALAWCPALSTIYTESDSCFPNKLASPAECFNGRLNYLFGSLSLSSGTVLSGPVLVSGNVTVTANITIITTASSDVPLTVQCLTLAPTVTISVNLTVQPNSSTLALISSNCSTAVSSIAGSNVVINQVFDSCKKYMASGQLQSSNGLLSVLLSVDDSSCSNSQRTKIIIGVCIGGGVLLLAGIAFLLFYLIVAARFRHSTLFYAQTRRRTLGYTQPLETSQHLVQLYIPR